MDQDRTDQVVVIFTSQRNATDATGYADAAMAMDRLAAAQPGYRSLESARGYDGFGIAVSWWADVAAPVAWREHPVHARACERGRARWCNEYEATVAPIGGSDRWSA